MCDLFQSSEPGWCKQSEELSSNVAPLHCIMLGGGVSKGEGSHHAWTAGSKKSTHNFELPVLSQAILENKM